MEKQIEQNPVLITGAARSGTSIVAGIINKSGAYAGKTSPGNRYNQKGMYENVKIRNTIVKPYLKNLRVDPKGQYPLPDPETVPIPNNWGKKVEDVLLEEGYKGGPYMYKGAKMCLFWPVWQHAFPDAKWIIVRRRTGDVVSSCMKTAFMNAFKNRDGWIWWVRQHEKRFIEMIQAGMNVKIVWPEKMLYGNYVEIQDAIEWLGLEWKPKIVHDFIDTKLWSSYNRKKKGVSNGYPDNVGRS